MLGGTGHDFGGAGLAARMIAECTPPPAEWVRVIVTPANPAA
jgi:hypothetical protein